MAVTTETIEIRLGSTRRLDDLEAQLNAVEAAANAAEDAISRMTDQLKADIGGSRQLQNRIKEVDQVRQTAQSRLNDTSPGNRLSARQRRTEQRRVETSTTEIDRLETERRQANLSIRERRAVQRRARADAKEVLGRRDRILNEYDGFFNDEIDKFTQSENRASDQLSTSARRARTARTQDLFRARQTDLRKMGREAAAGGKRLNEQNSRLNETADALQEEMAQLERYQDSITAFRDRIVRIGSRLLKRPGTSPEMQSRIGARVKEVEGAFAAESAEIQRTRQALTTQLSSVLQQRRGLNFIGKGRSVVADRAAAVRDRAARLRDEAGVSAEQLRVGIRVNGRTSRVTPANAAARAVLLANNEDNIDGAKAILDLVDRRLKRLERQVRTRDRLSETRTARQTTLDQLSRTDENFRTANVTGARVTRFRQLLDELNAFTGSRSGFNNLARLVKEAAQAVTIPAGFKTGAGARSRITGEAFAAGSPANINARESGNLRLAEARQRADSLRGSGVSDQRMRAIDASINKLASLLGSNRFAGPRGFDSQFANLRKRFSLLERSVKGQDAPARINKKISDREVESRRIAERLDDLRLRGAGDTPEFTAIKRRSRELSDLLGNRQFVDFDRVLKVVKADLDKVSGQLRERERLIKEGNNKIKAIDKALQKGGGFGPGEAAIYFGASFDPGVAGGGRPGLPARNQLLLPPGNPYLPAFRPAEGVSSRMGKLPPTMLNGVPVPRIVDRIGNIRTQDQTDFALRSTIAAQDSLREAERQNQEVLKSKQKRTAEEVKNVQSLTKQRDAENDALYKATRSHRYFKETLDDLTPVVDNQGRTFQAFKSKVERLGEAIINRDSRLFKDTALDAAAELASLRREIRSGKAGEAAANTRATAERSLSRSRFDINALKDQLVSNPQLIVAEAYLNRAQKAFNEGKFGEFGRLQKDLTDYISRAQRIAAAPDPRERLNSLVSSGSTFLELLKQAGKKGAPAKDVTDLSGSLGDILKTVTREEYTLSGKDLKLLESRVKAAREFLRTQNAIVAGKKQEVSLENQRQKKLDEESSRELGLKDIRNQVARLDKAGAKGPMMDALRENLETLERANDALTEAGQGRYFDRVMKAAKFNAREARTELREISGFTKERQKILSGVGSTRTKLFSLFDDGGVNKDEYRAIRSQLIDIAKNARTGAKDADALSSALGSVQRKIEKLASARSSEIKFGKQFNSELQNLEKSQGKLRELQLDSASASELRRRNSELITKAQKGELAVNSENLGVIEQQIAATNRLVAVQNFRRKARASRVDRATAEAELELLRGKRTGIEAAGVDTASDIFKSFQGNIARLETMVGRPRIMARDYNPLVARINKQFAALSKSAANAGVQDRQAIADSEKIQLVERLKGAETDLLGLQRQGVDVAERLGRVKEAITKAEESGFKANKDSLKLLREELRLTEQLKLNQQKALRNRFDKTGAEINLSRVKNRIEALASFGVSEDKLKTVRGLQADLTTAKTSQDRAKFRRAFTNASAELQNLESQYGVQQKLNAAEEKRLNSASRSEKIYKQIEARINNIKSQGLSMANRQRLDKELADLEDFKIRKEFGNFNRGLDTLTPLLDDFEKAAALRTRLFTNRKKARRPMNENRKALDDLIMQGFQKPDDPQIESLRGLIDGMQTRLKQGRFDLFNSLNLDFRDRISAINRMNTAVKPEQVKNELLSRLQATKLDLENIQGKTIMVDTPQGRVKSKIDETQRIAGLSDYIDQINKLQLNQQPDAKSIRIVTDQLNAAADRLTVARKEIRNAAASGQGGNQGKPLDPTVAARRLDGLQRQAQAREQELLMLQRKGIDVSSTLLSLQTALTDSKQDGLTITRETLASLGAQVSAAGQLIASEEKLRKLRQQDVAMRRFDDTANNGQFAGRRVAPALQTGTLTSMIASLKNVDMEAKVFRGGRSSEKALSDAIDAFNTSMDPRPLRDSSGKIAMSARGFEAGGVGVAGPNFGIPQNVAAKAGETATSVVSTFADKLASGAGRSAQAATKFASAATKAINRVFGRNSPPKFIIQLIKDIVSATTSSLENGTGAIEAAFSKAFKRGADAAKQALADLSRAPVQKAPLFTGQLGETSDKARRMAGFVARTSANPRQFRPLANLAGEEILDSPALNTAAQRRFYERIGLGPDPVTTYTNPETRRNVRGAEGIPGAGLEQQIVEAAMSRIAKTGPFISPIERSFLKGIGGQSMINPGVSMDPDGKILTGSPKAQGGSGLVPLFAVQEAKQEAQQLQQSVTQFTADLDAIGSIIKATSSKIGVAASKMASGVGAVVQSQALALPAAPPPPPPLMRATQAPPPPPPLMRATKAPPPPPPLEAAAGISSKSAPSTISADQRRKAARLEAEARRKQVFDSFVAQFHEAARIAAETDAANAAKVAQARAAQAPPPPPPLEAAAAKASTPSPSVMRATQAPPPPPPLPPTEALRIKSPSRVMTEIGFNLLNTYVSELEKAIPKIQAASDRIFNTGAQATARGAEAGIPKEAIVNRLPSLGAMQWVASRIAAGTGGMLPFGVPGAIPPDEALSAIQRTGKMLAIEKVPGIDYNQLENDLAQGNNQSPMVQKAMGLYRQFYGLDSGTTSATQGAADMADKAKVEAQQLQQAVTQLAAGLDAIGSFIRGASAMASKTATEASTPPSSPTGTGQATRQNTRIDIPEEAIRRPNPQRPYTSSFLELVAEKIVSMSKARLGPLDAPAPIQQNKVMTALQEKGMLWLDKIPGVDYREYENEMRMLAQGQINKDSNIDAPQLRRVLAAYRQFLDIPAPSASTQPSPGPSTQRGPRPPAGPQPPTGPRPPAGPQPPTGPRPPAPPPPPSPSPAPPSSSGQGLPSFTQFYGLKIKELFDAITQGIKSAGNLLGRGSGGGSGGGPRPPAPSSSVMRATQAPPPPPPLEAAAGISSKSAPSKEAARLDEEARRKQVFDSSAAQRATADLDAATAKMPTSAPSQPTGARRMAGFVARTSASLRQFRPLANLAGEEILDSPAPKTAAQRRFYERIGHEFSLSNIGHGFSLSNTAFRSAIADLLNKITQAIKSAGGSFAGAGGSGGGSGGGPRPPASSSGSNPGDDDLGRLANQNRGNLQGLLGLKDLANTSRASANGLTQFSAMLSELRAGMRTTDKGFRETTKVIKKVGDQMARLDPGADFLTRRVGPQTAQGLSEGLIGGAFPLLFGQGVGASIGGGVGGFLGGSMGGMLGFGLSLVGTAIGTAVDTLVQNTQNTGNALRGLARDVSGSFEQIKEAGLFASSAQERFVQNLIESGKVATAYAVIQDRVTQRLGIDGADRLKQAAEAGDRLNRAMNDLGVQMQLFIAGPLASFLEMMTGALAQGRRVSTTGEAFDQLSPNRQKQFLDELAKANIAAGADPAKSGFIYRSVPGGVQLFSGEGKAEDKADTFKRLTSNLAPAQIQRIFAGLNPSGNKPKPLSNQEKADLAVNTAQQNVTDAQARLDLASKRNESNDILRGFKQRNLAVKREQEDLDRQSFELRRDYERSIGDIRRGVEERISQIQQENRQKEIEGVVRQGEIRQQQLSNSAAAIRGGLAGDQIASDLADAVTSFLSAQLSAENQLQQRRMQFEVEVANLQLETEKYKIDVARSVAQLNLSTAERVQQINRGVARRNEDAATNIFNSEKEIASLRNDVLLNELLLMRAKRLVFLEQAKVNLQADPGNPNLRIIKEAEENIIKDYDKYVDRFSKIGKSIKTMSPPPRIRETAAIPAKGVSFSGVDKVASRRSQILEENMRREEELTALIKQGNKIELANRVTGGITDIRNEMSAPMTDALKSLQGQAGSTSAALQEIANSYARLIGELSADPKIVLSAKLSNLIAASMVARSALEELRPTYEDYTNTFNDLASKTSQARQEISDLLGPTTEYERILKRINESGGLSAGLGEERNKTLLDAAKYLDTLNEIAKVLGALNDIAGGITDSFINFNKELLKGANLMESVTAFAEGVADKTLDVILELTLRPIQEQLFKNMTKLLGIEAPQDPILLPISKISQGVDDLVREARNGFLIRESKPQPQPPAVQAPGGSTAPRREPPPPGLAPLPQNSQSSLPLGTVIGTVAGNPAQYTGMGGPGAATPQGASQAARMQALLDTISYAEGTFRNGSRGYNIRLGGSTFNNNLPHPGTVISAGKWPSNAHGAFQFLGSTWNMINNGQNPPMTSANQDQAALALIQRRGVNPAAPFSQQVAAKLAPEWASFPTMAGVSYYGQPVKRYPELERFYNQRLEFHSSQAAQAAAQPAPVTYTPEQMNQRRLDAMEDFYVVVQRAGEALAKFTDGLSGITIATQDTTVKAAEGAEKLNNSVNAFQRTTQIGLQAMSSIAMGIGGAQLVGRGGAYNVLMGAASIFGSISSITGMFGEGGSLQGVFGKKPAATPPAATPPAATPPAAAPIDGARRFGGPVFAGSQYLVGENGPELFTPSIGGTIVDNDELYVPGLDDRDSPGPSIGRYSRQGSGDSSMNNLTVPYQRSEASREIDRLEQVASNPRELPPIKYETTRINEYEFVTPEQLEASNARTAKAARNQTIRELADSMKTRKRLGIA